MENARNVDEHNQEATCSSTLPVSDTPMHLTNEFRSTYGLLWDDNNQDRAQPSGQTLRRLNKELASVRKNPIEQIDTAPVDENIFHWAATINGPNDTPYEGGVFHLDIRIPVTYTSDPPRIKFKTKVFHPNIDSAGRISMDLLGREWCPALTIDKLVLSICSLLDDPNPYEPLEPEIAEVYLTDRLRYEATVREWTREYAS